jgi:aminoglycoside phosphotransferase family enzyme/predicted kinase
VSHRPSDGAAGEQSAVIAFLSDPATHGGAPVERIDTHASIVFLAGQSAFKMKRAVTYDYLDFSTRDRRRAMCEAELAINARTAPKLYRRVRAVTRTGAGMMTFDGEGEPVEWVLEMARFDQAGLFDRLAAAGSLALDLMRPLAAAIASFHQAADRRPSNGGRAAMRHVIEGNDAGFRQHGAGVFDEAGRRRLLDESLQALDRVGELLDRRRAAGLVRQCHGDLHLRNIVLLDGAPTLFDAIEFNDELSCIDVFYDLAFLLMDLWRRDLPRHANAVLNGYLGDTGDTDGLAALPVFLSCRAAIRAKTSATAAGLQPDGGRRRELEALAGTYLEMALRLLHPPGPRLVAIGGLSGTGKSTLARALAPGLGAVPGAVVLRSDAIRKRLMGVAELTRLGAEAYAPDIATRVYAAVLQGARAVLATGHSAIADAVFVRAEDRAAVEAIATEAGVPFAGFWLDAPEETLVARVRARAADASDAGADVVRQQRTQDAGTIAWHHVDAGASPDRVQQQARAVLAGAALL